MPKVQAVEKVRSTDWVRTGSGLGPLGPKISGSEAAGNPKEPCQALGNPGTLEPEVINTSADLQVTV